MDSEAAVPFDNVKFEKAKAMARYNRFRKISKLVQFLEVLVALALVSWSSTRLPGAVKLSGEALLGAFHSICSTHVVFVIGNAIVVALFVLCREGGDSGGDDSGSGDLYDDYVRHSRRKVSVPEDVKTPPLTVETKSVSADDRGGSGGSGEDAEEKQIVCVSTEEAENKPAEQCEAATTAIDAAEKQIEKFQRTNSARLKGETAANPQPEELRRSETVKVGGRKAGRPETTSFGSVDRLSNEDFNRAIEAFIKRHQDFFKEQKSAENQEEPRQDFSKKYNRCASVR